MHVVITVLVGLLPAVAFYIFEPKLTAIGEPNRTIIAAAIFIGLFFLALLFRRFLSGTQGEGRSIAMRNKSKKDLDIEMKNVKAKGGSGNIASENESGGNTKIKISNSDL
jgi:hypothetical protein